MTCFTHRFNIIKLKLYQKLKKPIFHNINIDNQNHCQYISTNNNNSVKLILLMGYYIFKNMKTDAIVTITYFMRLKELTEIFCAIRVIRLISDSDSLVMYFNTFLKYNYCRSGGNNDKD